MESWDGCEESGEVVVLELVLVVKCIGYICGKTRDHTKRNRQYDEKGSEGKGEERKGKERKMEG